MHVVGREADARRAISGPVDADRGGTPWKSASRGRERFGSVPWTRRAPWKPHRRRWRGHKLSARAWRAVVVRPSAAAPRLQAPTPPSRAVPWRNGSARLPRGGPRAGAPPEVPPGCRLVRGNTACVMRAAVPNPSGPRHRQRSAHPPLRLYQATWLHLVAPGVEPGGGDREAGQARRGRRGQGRSARSRRRAPPIFSAPAQVQRRWCGSARAPPGAAPWPPRSTHGKWAGAGRGRGGVKKRGGVASMPPPHLRMASHGACAARTARAGSPRGPGRAPAGPRPPMWRHKCRAVSAAPRRDTGGRSGARATAPGTRRGPHNSYRPSDRPGPPHRP
jgi:hypothetical protein